MAVTRRDFLKAGAWSALGVSLGSALSFADVVAVVASETDPNHHVLNRTTWGIRQADLVNIQELGVEGWIDYQLNYEAIPDPLVDAFIAQRRVFSMPNDELARTASNNYGAVFEALVWGRLFRAAYSERQLFELMVEFWTDHFNIPAPDYLDLKFVDDRDVIRKHALGTFRELLLASAQSPAMLRYLDNAVSNKEHPNENYARELMELHTLGVDGGYTEVDVVEVARALTGWQVRDGSNTFYFNMNDHDTDPKTILGVQFPSNRGIEDGLQVLDLLARHPSTAHFISYKLCRRFVSDFPPPSLVDSTALQFIATDGDIKAVLRHILTSTEFMASPAQKFRRPTEFMMALLRVLHPALEVNNADMIVYGLEPMGQVPFHWFPPNGYPDVAGAWLNTNGILHRWNTALTIALAGDGLFYGSTLNIDAVVPSVATVGELVDAAIDRILGIQLPATERDQLIQFVSRTGDPNQAVDYDLRYAKLPSLVGILMASPYFQWH